MSSAADTLREEIKQAIRAARLKVKPNGGYGYTDGELADAMVPWLAALLDAAPVLSMGKHADHIHPPFGVEQVGWLGQSGCVYGLHNDPSPTEPGSFAPLYQARDEECGHAAPVADREALAARNALLNAARIAATKEVPEAEDVAIFLRGLADAALLASGSLNTAEPDAAHLAEIAAERKRVKAGPYGPDHDAEHGIAHLSEHARRRLDVTNPERRAWVEVGQFALAALELIDRAALAADEGGSE